MEYQPASQSQPSQHQPSHKVYHKDLASFPPGYNFRPKDHELIIYYLAPKLANHPLPPNQFYEVNIYESDPMKLSERYKPQSAGEWYFFTSRDRKYKKGERPNRAAGNGYWKATGCDSDVLNNEDVKIGYKRVLVYYQQGKPPNGIKTNWIMQEYRIDKASKRQRTGPDDMRLDDVILIKLYEKKERRKKKVSSKRSQNNIAARACYSHPIIQVHQGLPNGVVSNSNDPYQNVVVVADSTRQVSEDISYGIISKSSDLDQNINAATAYDVGSISEVLQDIPNGVTNSNDMYQNNDATGDDDDVDLMSQILDDLSIEVIPNSSNADYLYQQMFDNPLLSLEEVFCEDQLLDEKEDGKLKLHDPSIDIDQFFNFDIDQFFDF